MKLAAQMFTVRAFTKTEQGVAESLKKIKQIGYDAVQISAFGYYDAKRIKDLLDENGLAVCVTHTPPDRIRNETDEVIAEHKLFGAKYVGIGWHSADSLDGYKKLLDDFAPAAEKIAAAGMKLLYHNHEHEFIKFDGVRPIDYMRDNTQPEKWGFIADLYWVQYAGESPVRFVKEYAGRIPVVHFKDMRAVKRDSDKTRIAEIFEGNMDYLSIYDACIAADCEWAAVEQDVCEGDPFDCLAKSFRNIKDRHLF